MHKIGEIDGESMMPNSYALIADPGYHHDYWGYGDLTGEF